MELVLLGVKEKMLVLHRPYGEAGSFDPTTDFFSRPELITLSCPSPCP